MKKIISMLLLGLMTLGMAQVVSAQQAYTKLVIGLDENFPPMGFRDDKGELVGFDIDLAREAGKRLNVETVFQPIDWSSKELELSAKKIDMLWNGVTITPEREEQMLFTKPYMKNRQVIIVTEDSDVKTKADLSGKVIGLQKESSAMDAVKKDPIFESFKEIQEYSNNISAFTDLKIGRISAVVVDEIAARYYITQSKSPFVVLEDHFGLEDYGVAMRKDDTQLQADLQKVLEEMNADGTSAKISEKWFNENLVISE